jgi:hypothetical protein
MYAEKRMLDAYLFSQNNIIQVTGAIEDHDRNVDSRLSRNFNRMSLARIKKKSIELALRHGTCKNRKPHLEQPGRGCYLGKLN